jgi:hypothetical protein
MDESATNEAELGEPGATCGEPGAVRVATEGPDYGLAIDPLFSNNEAIEKYPPCTAKSDYGRCLVIPPFFGAFFEPRAPDATLTAADALATMNRVP